jgi:phosphoribosylformylglycinamidine synthase PurS subunit
MWLARVYVTLKPTMSDPRGLAIRGGLHHLGFESVESVRAGKYLELRLDEPPAPRQPRDRGVPLRSGAGGLLRR